MTISITDDNFDAEVLNSDEIIMVDCFADWCSPCKALKPLLVELAKKNNVTLGLLDIDVCPELAKSMKITSIPKVMIFKNGEQIISLTGIHPENDYQNVFDNLT